MNRDEIVYDGWLKVVKRKAGERSYDILLAPPAVAAWVMNSGNEVLLVRQYRPSVMDYTWEIPAGILDKPQLTKEEIVREELEEEASIDVPIEKLAPMITYVPHIGHNGSEITIYYSFLENTQQGKCQVDDKDVIEAAWVSLSRIEEMIEKKEIKDEKTILAYYCYLNRKGR